MPKRPVFLFIFANDPQQSLDLPNEERTIWNALKHLHDQEIIEYRALHNVTVKDLYQEINDFSGRIALFHFGGHSDGDFLNLSRGETEAQNLAVVLGSEKNLKLVFLNGCANLEQVDELFTQKVPAVIATTSAIEDKTAVGFAGQFYSAIANYKTINAAYTSASAFIRDNDKVELATEAQNWRSVVEKTRGLAPRSGSANPALPWGLNHNNNSKALEWKLPRKISKWVYGIPILVVIVLAFIFNLWKQDADSQNTTNSTYQEPPLCPTFTDSATFKIAVLPFEAGALKPEREISNMLNKWNKIHRTTHSGRALFLAESAVSGKKLEVINPSTIDSLWTVCNVQMVIGGYSYKKADGSPFGVQLQLSSVKEVAIDAMTRLPYEESMGFNFIDSIEVWSSYVFSLIDGYFKCYDPALAQKLEEDLANKYQNNSPIAERLLITSQYRIANQQQEEAARLMEKYTDTVNASPKLIQNLGLCYTELGEFKKASKALARMPESSLNAQFLQFRWKTHRKAGYLKPALADINRLLVMNTDPGIKTYLNTEKVKIEQILKPIERDTVPDFQNWKQDVINHLDHRNSRDAASIAQRYINKNPKEFEAYTWALNIFLQKGYAELGCETIKWGKTNRLSNKELQQLQKKCGSCCVQILD